MVKHTATANCRCEPTKKVNRKQSTSGAYGKHQGYKQEVTYLHNFLES